MRKRKFITVTLKPSMDRTLSIHYLALGYHNLTQGATRLDPAGRGVNISRALHQFNHDTHAIILLGDDAVGRAYEALVSQEGFPVSIIRTAGQTRSNTIIVDTGNKNETHIIEEAAEVDQTILQQVADTLQELIVPGDVVVFAGTLPSGASADTYNWLATVARQAGATIVVANSGAALEEVLKNPPEVVALTQLECETFFNYPVRVQEGILSCGRQLRQRGAKTVLIEMLDAGQAILIADEGEWLVSLPDESKGTTSGVRAAMLAGFLISLTTRQPLTKSLELGAAAASYTASQVGSEFGSTEKVEELLEEVVVAPVDETNGMPSPGEVEA